MNGMTPLGPIILSKLLGGSGSGGGGTVTPELADALLYWCEHCAFADQYGGVAYAKLEAALYPIASITAVYTQSGTVYDTDSLNSLKADLVVTAIYENGTTATVPYALYTLSGTLTAGTSTITVEFRDKTTTFDVVVTHQIVGWYYPFDGSLLSAGTEDFGFVGQEVYAQGFDDRQCYSHIVPVLDDASSDTQLGLKAVNLSKYPNFGSDFTLSLWCKTQKANTGHPVWATKTAGTGDPSGFYFSSHVVNKTGWSVVSYSRNGKAFSGAAIQITNGNICFRITNVDATASGFLQATPPSGFDYQIWHHFAITRKGSAVRLFVDGELICTATAADNTVYPANQIAISSYFQTASGSDPSDLAPAAFGELVQDLFVAEYCKWENSFDPTDIAY